MIPNKTKLTALLFIATISIVGCGSGYSDDDSHLSDPVSDIELSTDYPYSEYNASWLAGSWGITQRIDGGYKLDASANSSDWVAGANEVVANIPSAGHVITSFTPLHMLTSLHCEQTTMLMSQLSMLIWCRHLPMNK